jgi:cyclopropane fatty-acyl-phospholipid synthase-like methyltransferase
LDSPKEAKVLEIGSGAGQILKFFEDSGCRTVGVELSKKMCELCSQQSPKSFLINDNIEEISFCADQFDLIYMGAVIHLFPLEAEEKLMNMVRAWLKPSGYLFINTTCNEESDEGFFDKKDYSGCEKRFRRRWNEHDFEDFIKDRGFTIVEKLYTDEKDKRKKWVAFIAQREK